jgi:hypothetical protein
MWQLLCAAALLLLACLATRSKWVVPRTLTPPVAQIGAVGAFPLTAGRMRVRHANQN